MNLKTVNVEVHFRLDEARKLVIVENSMPQEEPPAYSRKQSKADQAENQFEDDLANFYGNQQPNYADHGNQCDPTSGELTPCCLSESDHR